MLNYQMNVQAIDDISWIVEAAQEVINATESDFEAIRAKKWYKRLWETVTFSKDNQIKLAKGVSSLSKLQEIMIRLLVVLSQNNTEISDTVKQNSDLINKLSVTDLLLSKQIDRIRFGGTSQIEFSDLDREKKATIASLLLLADPAKNRTDYSKQYISSILTAANITSIDNTVRPEAVDSLNREEQELLYRMIMIGRYLMDVDFDDPSEVIDCIPISMKRAKEIRTSILETACAVSPEFFVTYYEKTAAVFDEVTDVDIWFEEFADKETNEAEKTAEAADPTEYEDIVLSSILHIPQGETYRFENKSIHVQTIIDCEGDLEFYNCAIHYGEVDQLCEIKIKEVASLSLTKCMIEGYSIFKGSSFFNIDSKNCTVSFNDCHLINCGSFIKTSTKVEFLGCTVTNIGTAFLNANNYYNKEEPVVIQNTTLITENPPEFIQKSRKDSFERIISANSIALSQCTINDTLRIQSADEASQIDNCWSTFIFADHFTVENSYFKGVPSIFRGSGSIQNSTFEECYEIVNKCMCLGSLDVKECTFVKCTNIGSEVHETTFQHCKFIDCFNNLIRNEIMGKSNIEYCEFIRWSAVREIKPIIPRAFSRAMIELGHGNDKEYGSSFIKNCVFDGITAHQYYLIKGSVYERIDGVVASIENCSFINCTTERDNGKIIMEYGSYFGLFNKKIEVKTISVANNCRGLDKVKKV